ncbi:ABC transporter ATP-binding protein [Haloprofundus sp. MHR1]|uniref:ABC transporter ATP-binding protein n=1 Tax=Haloprofundus sp. MHR1 TaxID=2572921 RepID=UPI0010BEFA40|nr:ABC transporter ATP-binding protein [Haloprofundus sp. MHR1]QCJ47939.1 ABC transporter ATP-binding protein [Haloprofundus sp. MHR1]
MDEVLVADDVRKRYGDTVALDGVSLSVGAGEVFGLIGPNGAGKTTLVRALTGTTRADGTVRVFDGDPEDADEQRVSLLPQSFSPPARLTARELVAYYAGLYDDSRDPDAVLADVGLTDAADTWYENLSGGQQRRACVGISLVNDPDLLFLDEPTTGIDPAGRRSLWALLEGLAAGGTTVFLTSHSMAEVERLSDRVGLLADGKLVAVGTPDSLVAEYGGESRLVVRPETSPSAAAEALSKANPAFDLAVDGEELVFRDVEPERIGPAVDALDSAGVRYDALTWKQPSLEDVYLRLTGDEFAAFDRPTAAGRTADAGGAEETQTVDAGAPAGSGGER